MTEAIEQDELDALTRALLVEFECTLEFLTAPGRRHLCRQARRFDQARQAIGFGGAQARVSAREASRRDHPDRHRLAVEVTAIAG